MVIWSPVRWTWWIMMRCRSTRKVRCPAILMLVLSRGNGCCEALNCFVTRKQPNLGEQSLFVADA